jgi:hypothetical protein
MEEICEKDEVQVEKDGPWQWPDLFSHLRGFAC